MCTSNEALAKIVHTFGRDMAFHKRIHLLFKVIPPKSLLGFSLPLGKGHGINSECVLC